MEKTAVNIEQGREMIALFMGATKRNAFGVVRYCIPGYSEIIGISIDHLPYNSSWDMLMPVVEKIESLGYTVKIEEQYCLISGMGQGEIWGCIPHNPRGVKKIDAVFMAVLQFVQANTAAS